MRNLIVDDRRLSASFQDEFDDVCMFTVPPTGVIWVGADEHPMKLTRDDARDLGAMLIAAANTGKIMIEDHQFKPERLNMRHAIELLKRLTDLEFETMINIMNMVLIAHKD